MKKSNKKSKLTRGKLAKSTASDESNDTIASRRYLKNSLAQDPWTDDNSKDSTKNDSEQRSTQLNDSRLLDASSKRKTYQKRSMNMVSGNMLDVPNLHDSTTTKLTANTTRQIESVDIEEKKSTRRSRVATKKDTPTINTNRKNRGKETIPPTQQLSSLGLDESEEGNRSSVFSSYWDNAKNPHFADEESSGAMALVRSIEGEIVQKQEMKRRYCYCILNKLDARVVLFCFVLFGIVVVLVWNIPYDKSGGNDTVIAEKEVPMLLPVDLEDTNTTAIQSNETKNSNKLLLSMAEAIIQACNPKGSDQDPIKCKDFCNGKECCFVDRENERGVRYCGDEIWHDCLTFAGCQPFFL